MKKMNVFGAVLCSAALATTMAMPAFAADQKYEGAASDPLTPETTVTLTALSEANISVTLPLTMTVSVATSNGGAITSPDATSYQITNTGDITVKVTKVATTELDNWAIQDAAIATAPSNTSEKQCYLTMNPDGQSQVILNGDKTVNWTLSSGSAIGMKVEGQAWAATAAGASEGLKTISSGDFVKIAYTVSA